MKGNPKKNSGVFFILLLLVLAVLVLFIPGCAFSDEERADEEVCPEISKEIPECLCETIEPERTNTAAAVVSTPSPVEPVHITTLEEKSIESAKLSGSYMDGKIIFQWVSNQWHTAHYEKELMVVGDNNLIRYIGYFAGSPAISPDGNSLAVGMISKTNNDQRIVNEIYILDLDLVVDGLLQYPEIEYSPTSSKVLIKELTLPDQCLQYQYDFNEFSSRYEGILSLSWSPGADRLAVVCGDPDSTEVCILSLKGDTQCWDEAAAEDVYRVAWSPTEEDTLVISGKLPGYSYIYLVEPDGSNKRFLTKGWNPEWSPDGKRIAYLERDPKSNHQVEGIAVINPDGSGHDFLYQNNPNEPGSYIQLDINSGDEQAEANRIAWSPNGRYLAFTGTEYNQASRLYRLDIETGEIIKMTDPFIFDFWVTEVDWGP